MKTKGASIIFLNSALHVLLLLRDDNPRIPFPNRWDLPGGHMEGGETPEACIRREMQEEMALELSDVRLFDVFEMPDRIEYTFWQRADFKIEDIDLREGQKIMWFPEKQAGRLKLAYGFNKVIDAFFALKPWTK